ncbi:hypothetical protein K4A83_01750 [Spirulina subsalsa FACHB-351]|uniref:Uncharacterized protein n=1 Tax=Spirulina subsalsa FACHB-351 TaxID=234711 RepID=A0ABT3L0H3_9CYAN|nr:hypothetical protein [Spirulina subsalsa]MCW6034999.1 hypothetical protein [Spirulina subsalsa FACHB-351]
MAGLFGLFGGKKNQDSEAGSAEQSGAFFLDADSAKTLGNTEFMRRRNTIKRTFPGVRGQKGFAVVKEVSSSEEVDLSSGTPKVVTSADNSTPAASEPNSSVTPTRRASDNKMDMFRQMAKDMKR